MDIEKYCQYFLGSITLMVLSFQSPPPPNEIFEWANFEVFSNFSVFDKEKAFRKKAKAFNSNVFDKLAIERVYHIVKLSMTYEEAWKLPLTFK